MRLGLLLPEHEDLGPELHCLLKVKEDLQSYTPISPRNILVPRVPMNIFVDRTHICETIGNLRTITDNHLGRSGAIASVLRESGTEKVIG